MYHNYIIIESKTPGYFSLDIIKPELALLSAIFGTKCDQLVKSEFPTLATRFSEIFKTLTETETEILLLRFGFKGNFYTLYETAIKLNLTPLQVTRIEKKALRKLRHPSRSRLINIFPPEFKSLFTNNCSFDYKETLINNIEQYLCQYREDAVFLNSIFSQKNITLNYIIDYSMDIKELGLSNRTYNSLICEGISTLKDLLSKTERELLHIKNLGKKCLDELNYKMIELGEQTGGHQFFSFPSPMYMKLKIGDSIEYYKIDTSYNMNYRQIAESLYTTLEDKYNLTDGLILKCDISNTLLKLLVLKGYFYIDDVIENSEKIFQELLNNDYISYAKEFERYCQKYKFAVSDTIKFWIINPTEACKLFNKISQANTIYLRYNIDDSPSMKHILDENLDNPPDIINLKISDSMINYLFPQE